MEIAIGLLIGLVIVGAALWLGLRSSGRYAPKNWHDENKHTSVPESANESH